MSPACTSTQVFRRKGPELFQSLRCGRQRTEWEGGTSGSEHPDTTVCRPWATKAHSQIYPLLVLTTPVHGFDSAFLNRFTQPRRLTRPGNGLRGSVFLSPYRFPQFANARSVVDFGSSLTIKARTVTILSGHTVLFQSVTRTWTLHLLRILLGSIRPPRGRQSRNESRTIVENTIALTPYNSKKIDERCSLRFGLTFALDSLPHFV